MTDATNILDPGNYSVFVLSDDLTWEQPTYRVESPMSEHDFRMAAEIECGGFQLWQVRKLPEGSKNAAEVTCWTDTPGANHDRPVQQFIPYTDFPFDAVGETFQFYVEGTGRQGDRWVALLKSEH